MADDRAYDLLASSIITGRRVISPGRLRVENGRVAEVGPAPAGARVPSRTLVPGFVDLQVNGVDDLDCAQIASAGDWNRIGERLLATGVTTWCPTLVSAPLDSYADPIASITAEMERQTSARRPGPTIAGVHLEGPFLGAAVGAHRPDVLVDPDIAWLDALALGTVVRVVTLAPERRGAIEAIAHLTGRGVLVAVGHSTADAAQVAAAADAGARLVTHLFNAMPGLHHRAPGLAGVALTDERLVPSLIADGVHVDPMVLRLATRAKGAGRWALVTDSVAWRSRRLPGRSVAVVDGAPRLPDGTLAGSALTMPEAISTMVTQAGVDLVDAVAAASTVPAGLLGLADRGHLEPGAVANVVALTDDPRDAVTIDHVWTA